MIYYTDCKDKGKIIEALNLCNGLNGVCHCRISSLMNSYGDYEGLVSLWIQCDKNNYPTAVIIKYGGDMTVSIGENADTCEIGEFIMLVGAASVLSERKLFDSSERGIIMQLAKKKVVDNCNNNLAVNFSPNLSAVYKLLESCNGKGFESPSYEDFILDTSHKIRHSCAECCAIECDNTVISYAMTAAVTDESAVIGAVCTQPKYRGQGYGSVCVRSLIDRLGNRKILIMRASGENESFYKGLGFENCGEFYIYRQSDM